MGETEKVQGFVKKTVIFLVPTHIGDRFLNKEEFEFMETRGNDGWVIVNEKEKRNA